MICFTKSPQTLIMLLFFNLAIAQAQNSIGNSSQMDPEDSISQNTKASENHQTLLAVVKAADLEEVLNTNGPFTVFAPSDLAFTKMPKGKMATLLHPENKKELKSFLTYHIVAGKISASKILKAISRGAGKASFTTVQGEELIATMVGLDIILTDNYGNTATITRADENQCNGVIHEIDSVILPKRI